MQEHIEEHHLRSETKVSPFLKAKQFISEHQTASIVALFLLLPVLVIGTVAAFINVSTKKAESTMALTPTPTMVVQNVDEGDDMVEVEATPTTTSKLTVTPTKKATTTPKPSSSTTTAPTATTGPTSTPTQKLANVYFHSVVCNYAEGASGSATIKRLDDVTFTSSSEMPNTATCDVVFQNSEETETGEITYVVLSDSDQHKKNDVGKLKKGNYPSGEYKSYQEIITLKKTSGSHELKFEINPEQNGQRLFNESNYSDNVRSIKYKVQ